MSIMNRLGQLGGVNGEVHVAKKREDNDMFILAMQRCSNAKVTLTVQVKAFYIQHCVKHSRTLLIMPPSP